jgi:hypothetical protein
MVGGLLLSAGTRQQMLLRPLALGGYAATDAAPAAGAGIQLDRNSESQGGIDVRTPS